jgi:hypothetical protein
MERKKKMYDIGNDVIAVSSNYYTNIELQLMAAAGKKIKEIDDTEFVKKFYKEGGTRGKAALQCNADGTAIMYCTKEEEEIFSVKSGEVISKEELKEKAPFFTKRKGAQLYWVGSHSHQEDYPGFHDGYEYFEKFVAKKYEGKEEYNRSGCMDGDYDGYILFFGYEVIPLTPEEVESYYEYHEEEEEEEE